MRRFLLSFLLVSLLFSVGAGAQTKLNPQTQIAWPSGISGCVYVPGTNTCAPARAVQTQRAPLVKAASLAGTLGTSYNAQAGVSIYCVGNSLCATDTGSALNFVPGGIFDSILAGNPVRQATSITCAGGTGAPCTITVNNADGLFQAPSSTMPVGSTFTPTYAPTFDSGCLAGTYYVTSATATTVTFNTANAWPGSCAAIGSTAYTSWLIPNWRSMGLNGDTLSGWYTSSGQYGFAGLQALVQQDIQNGVAPVIIVADGCLATNDMRTDGMSFSAHEAECKTVIDAIEGISAIGPDGLTHSVADVGYVYAESGTPFAALWTTTGTASGTPSDTAGTFIVGQTQYVCTNGGPANSPGTCTAAYSAPVTSGAISPGVNTVTLNYCDELLFPGYGISPVDFYQSRASGLYKDGTPIELQLDTVGSGVQEWVQPTAIIPASGAGANGFPSCSVTFTAAYAHAAGVQVVTGNNTATQILSSLRIQFALDMASWYSNIFVSDTTTPLSKTINAPGTLVGNQLHTTQTGFTLDHQPTFSMLASILNSGAASPQQSIIGTADTNEAIATLKSPIDPTFNTQAAGYARKLSGLTNAFVQYSKACLDPNYWYTVAQYVTPAGGNGAGYVRLTSPNSFASSQTLTEMQTGDAFYNIYTGCVTPTTITGATTNFSNVAVVVTYTGGVNFATAGLNGGPATGVVAIQRPLYVSPAAATFAHEHPFAIQVNWIGVVQSSSTTNSLVFTLKTGQPNGDINPTCSEVSMQNGDYIAFGNSSQTVIQLGTGTLTGSGSTCTWTDTSSTNYATYSTYPMNIFGLNRAPDKKFGIVQATSFVGAQVSSSTGVKISGALTPPAPTCANGGSTGGYLSNGTYYYKISYVPLSNTAAQDGPMSPPTATPCTLSAGTSTQVSSVRWGGNTPPAGYGVNVYGRPSTSGGTYGLIASGLTIGTTYNDNANVTPTTAPHSADLSVTGQDVYAPTAPTASGQVCTSVTSGTNGCAWGSGLIPGWTVTGSGSSQVATAPGTLSAVNGVYSGTAEYQFGSTPFVIFGDSLACLGGNQGPVSSLPNELSLLTGGTVVGQGVPGNTSIQIAIRQGGLASTIVSGVTIPTSGNVTLSFAVGYEPANTYGGNNGAGCYSGPAIAGTSGTLGGVHGTYLATGSGTGTFTPSTYPGSPVVVAASAPFVVDTPYSADFFVIEDGYNNYSSTSTILANDAEMVASLPYPKKYVVTSVITSATRSVGNNYCLPTPSANCLAIQADNAGKAAANPGHYVDTLTPLLNGCSPASSQVGAIDAIDKTNGVVPTSCHWYTVGVITASIASGDTSICVNATAAPVVGDVAYLSTTGSDPEANTIEGLLVNSAAFPGTCAAGSAQLGVTRAYATGTAGTYTTSSYFGYWNSLHLNKPGYALQAAAIYAWSLANNTDTLIGTGDVPGAVTSVINANTITPVGITTGLGTFTNGITLSGASTNTMSMGVYAGSTAPSQIFMYQPTTGTAGDYGLIWTGYHNIYITNNDTGSITLTSPQTYVKLGDAAGSDFFTVQNSTPANEFEVGSTGKMSTAGDIYFEGLLYGTNYFRLTGTPSGQVSLTMPATTGTLAETSQLPLTGTTGTITGTALTATCDSGTASVTGAVVGAPVVVSSTTGADVGGAFNVRGSVTATGTVTVYVCGTGTPASLAYNVRVIQ